MSEQEKLESLKELNDEVFLHNFDEPDVHRLYTVVGQIIEITSELNIPSHITTEYNHNYNKELEFATNASIKQREKCYSAISLLKGASIKLKSYIDSNFSI